MNNTQRTVLILATIAIAVLFLFPPFCTEIHELVGGTAVIAFL